MFCGAGYLWVWTHSLRGDPELYAGVLSVPLILSKVEIGGDASSMNVMKKASLAILRDDAAPHAQAPHGGVRIVISGGILSGSASQQSRRCPEWTLLEVGAASSGPWAKFVAAGTLKRARCGHSASYIPPRLAGATHPQGCVVMFGGEAVSGWWESAELLSLDTLTSELVELTQPSGSGSCESGIACRAGHSAVLLESSSSPQDEDAQIFLCGGSQAGKPQRNLSEDSVLQQQVHPGQRLLTSHWLRGLQAGPLRLEPIDEQPPFNASDRLLATCRLLETSTVLILVAEQASIAAYTFRQGQFRKVQCVPPAVDAFRCQGQACCSHPDGTVLFYDGEGMWAAHAGSKPAFFLEAQRELSFLTKMRRRAQRLRKEASSSSDDGEPHPVVLDGAAV